MKQFNFPTDKELYPDVTAPKDSNEVFLHRLFGSQTGFAGEVEAKVSELCNRSGGTVSIRDGASDYVKRQYERTASSKATQFMSPIIQIADRYTEGGEVGDFPRSAFATYTIGEGDSARKWDLDYFDFMNKSGGCIGRAGKLMSSCARLKEKLDRKQDRSTGIKLFFFLMIIFLIFCSGDLLPVVPDLMINLMDGPYGFWVRLAACGVLLLSTLFLIPLAEAGGTLLKVVCNGLFDFIAIAGAAGAALYLLLIDRTEPASGLYFLPFAIYYVLVLLSICIDLAAKNRKIERERREATAEFIQVVESDIEFLHRSIRFHTLWWKNLHGDQPLPSGIANMQAMFDDILKRYQTLAG